MLVTQSDFEHCLNRIHGTIYVDTETTGLDVYGEDSKHVMCGVAIRKHPDSYYFPFRHREGYNLPTALISPLMRRLESAQMRMFNAPFDLNVLWKEGLDHDAWALDVMNAAHLCNENEGRGNYGLSDLGKKYIDPEADMYDRLFESYLESKLLTKSGIWLLPSDKVEPYACGDVELTQDLDRFYAPHLAAQDLLSVWVGVSKYAAVMGHIMRRGLPIDLDVVDRAMKEANRRIHDLAMEVYSREGRMVPINSPSKAADWLGVESTEERELERLVGRDDWRVNILLSYRRAQRAIGSYYKPLLRSVGNDNRYHPDISLIGTITGRPAFWGGSGEMNPLALPRDTTSYRVKHAIVAPEGQSLMQVDFRNAEMRLASHYAREDRMKAIFKANINVHRKVSNELGIPYDRAKRINFSVIYGIGPRSLAEDLDIDWRLAADYLDRYHARYPGFRILYRDAERTARVRGYVRMWTGRRRHYNRGHRTPTHKASDHIIQGGVGELLRVKQTGLHEALPECEQILQVYDSAIMLVPEGKEEWYAEEIRALVEEKDRFTVPMEVDIGYGKCLAEMKEVV